MINKNMILVWTLFLFTMGCASFPNNYYQTVKIIKGSYSGYYGRIIGDCPGFEKYKVRLISRQEPIVCVRIWNMEKIEK